jgi:pyrroloquinoline quinone biosynthesis protein B
VDNGRWLLINASPDLPSQIAAFPPLAPAGRKLRGTRIEAVVLTDGELDHVTGLLSLREGRELHLVCTQSVRELLTRSFPILPVLKEYLSIRVSDFPIKMAGLRVLALDLGSEGPLYGSRSKRPGQVVGLRIESATRRLAYLPGLAAITTKLEAFVDGCDCLLLDGTFSSEREMVSLGLSKRTATDMGHVPIQGRAGSLRWLRTLKIPRKIYIHINNTNPILRKASRARRSVERAGVEVAYDGMEICL